MFSSLVWCLILIVCIMSKCQTLLWVLKRGIKYSFVNDWTWDDQIIFDGAYDTIFYDPIYSNHIFDISCYNKIPFYNLYIYTISFLLMNSIQLIHLLTFRTLTWAYCMSLSYFYCNNHNIVDVLIHKIYV